MTQSFNGVTFYSGNWSAGLDTAGLYTGTTVLSALNVTSVTFTGTLNDPGALPTSDLTLNVLSGHPAVTISSLSYAGYLPASDTHGDPGYILLADVVGVSTPVAILITTDPAGTSGINLLTSINTSPTTTAPPSTNPTPPVCFASGTLIRTARGEVAVEELSVGDEAVTASGAVRPIVWIGHRRIERLSRDERPVRVMAGAFGDGLPERDLVLSPGHAVCVGVVEEAFVPIIELVNGATIVREDVSEVTYWHVELESHDVLLAEGLPCESYLEMDNRVFFGRAYGRLASVDADRDPLAEYARPLVDAGPTVEALRERLTLRAEALGWSRVADVDLHLVVDGARVEPEIEGGLARFVFPATAEKVLLLSRTFSPAWSGQSRDQRELGVLVKSLEFSDGLGARSRITPDDPSLGDGFHGLEPGGDEALRWTNGAAPLPASLWQDCAGPTTLALAFHGAGGWAWIAPQGSLAASMARAA
jgi:hypothetical protein